VLKSIKTQIGYFGCLRVITYSKHTTFFLYQIFPPMAILYSYERLSIPKLSEMIFDKEKPILYIRGIFLISGKANEVIL